MDEDEVEDDICLLRGRIGGMSSEIQTSTVTSASPFHRQREMLASQRWSMQKSATATVAVCTFQMHSHCIGSTRRQHHADTFGSQTAGTLHWSATAICALLSLLKNSFWISARLSSSATLTLSGPDKESTASSTISLHAMRS